jgi:hypothetical protein
MQSAPPPSDVPRSEAPPFDVPEGAVPTRRRGGRLGSSRGRAFHCLGLVAVLSLGACKLIDQTTFAPAPEAKPVAASAPGLTPTARVDPRTPLAVIDFAIPNPAYRGPLGYAVRAAEARDQAVQFDVVAATPGTDQAAASQEAAAGVMRALLAEHVPAGRIHLGLQTDPALAANQVRVYVR